MKAPDAAVLFTYQRRYFGIDPPAVAAAMVAAATVAAVLGR